MKTSGGSGKKRPSQGLTTTRSRIAFVSALPAISSNSTGASVESSGTDASFPRVERGERTAGQSSDHVPRPEVLEPIYSQIP